MKRVTALVITCLIFACILSGVAAAKENPKGPDSHPIFVLKTEVEELINNALTPIIQAIAALEERIEDLESGGDGCECSLKQKVYEGTIDTSADGDIILGQGLVVHWKEISVPEVDLSNMPNIAVYGPVSFPEAGGDVWTTVDQIVSGYRIVEGKVLVPYKCVAYGQENIYFDRYKIVVTYQEQ